MNPTRLTFLVVLPVFTAFLPNAYAEESWSIDSLSEWQANVARMTNVELIDGFASPTGERATLTSKFRKLSAPCKAKSITITQSPVWQNWEPTENIGPENLADAPVMLSLGPRNYWMFGRYQSKRGKNLPKHKPESVTLDGFDVPLKSTPYKNQYNALGGTLEGMGGYHAWQSRDMLNWVHHGPITEGFARWMTTAEYADGKAYFYYDFPNDQDPHVYVDEDLFDGKPGKNMGMVLADPSHGSDCATFRDRDGRFHIIFENWDPIHAQSRSWDSPLAGHAVGPSGVGPFKIVGYAVDERTTPIGEIKTYKHPHWAKEDPKNYKTNVAEYEVHEPDQEAFGDWAAICVGRQYYLFGDYDPKHGAPMSVAWFTSTSLDKRFEFCGHIGDGHPDPDICFAEGKFYLATQQPMDFVSPGPWVETVEVRVGVDSDNDDVIDQWTDWQEVKESYDYAVGFAKHVDRKPAKLNLSELPKGYGFQFELRIRDTTKNQSKPILDRVVLSYLDGSLPTPLKPVPGK